MLIPTCIVIVMAVRGVNIFACLGMGSVLAVAIGLGAGLFEIADLVYLHDGQVSGSITPGIAGMFNVSVLLMLVVAMGQVLIASGCMEAVVDWLNAKVIRSERDAEVAMFGLATAFGILIAAINTIANICVSPFVNAIGKDYDVHPYRRASILATAVCSFPFFLPYGGCVLLLLGGIAGQQDIYPFLPTLAATDIIPTAFYCWAIWAVMLICCLTGMGRAFEGRNGEYVKGRTNPNG